MFSSSVRTLVVVGAQWGDEGKGKLVDVIAERADWVVRYQGGANAGHTVKFGDRSFVLHQIPSGILHPGVRCAIGNGVVLDPETLFTEIDELVRDGVDVEGRLYVSDRAHLVLPYHKLVDGAERREQGNRHHGSRHRPGVRGQGRAPRRACARPAAPGEVARAASRQASRMPTRSSRVRIDAARERRRDAATARAARAAAARLSPTTSDCRFIARSSPAPRFCWRARRGRCSTSITARIRTSRRAARPRAARPPARASRPRALDAVLGVVKAYTTRVGNGPLPTELAEPLASEVRKLGNEFGATTGRPRRCGWFDAVVVRYAARVNGLTGSP